MKFLSSAWPKRFGLAVLLFGVAGCALLPTAAVMPRGDQALYELRSWRLEGRIGVKTPDEGWTANLFWEHDGHQDRLRISGPFSQGMLSIIVQDDLIHINEGNGVEQTSRDPDALLRERLGFTVPLRSLRYWVTGVPSPGVEYVPQTGTTSGGRRGFTQQGWSLIYEAFSQVGDLTLPQKATIRGHDVRLRLIADDWVIEE
jgi:outer membrane lipoprotein LolB